MQEGGGNKIVKLSKEGHIDWELKLLVIAFIFCLNSFLQKYILYNYFCFLFFCYLYVHIYMLNKYMRTAQPSGGRWSYDDATKQLFKNTYLRAIGALAMFVYHFFRSGTTPSPSLLLSPTLSILFILEFRPCVMAINDKYPYLRELN